MRYTVTSKTEKRRHTIKIGAFCLIVSSFIAVAVLFDISADFGTLKETQERSEQYQTFISKAEHLIAGLRSYSLCLIQNSISKFNKSKNSNFTMTHWIVVNDSEKVCLVNASLNVCANARSLDCSNLTLINLFEMTEKYLQTLDSLVHAIAGKLQDCLTVHRQHYAALMLLYRELCLIAAIHQSDVDCHYAKQNYLKTQEFVLSQLTMLPMNLEPPYQSPNSDWNEVVQNYRHEVINITCINATSDFSRFLFFERTSTVANIMHYIQTYLLTKSKETNEYFASETEKSTVKLLANSSVLMLLTLLIAVVIVIVNAMNEWMYEFSKHIKDKSLELKAQKQFADNLLYQMLPPFIARQLMANKPVMAESFDCVSIFFSDIVGFTEISAKSTPFQVGHYANMSVQYTAIFHGCKNGNFQMRKCEIFLIFAQNIDCGYMLEPPH